MRSILKTHDSSKERKKRRKKPKTVGEEMGAVEMRYQAKKDLMLG